MYMFDVDGPIVEPNSETITHPQIISDIINELKAGRVSALITDRSVEWLLKDAKTTGYTNHKIQAGVVVLIEHQADDKSILDNLFVSAEFGGCTITYHNSERVINIQPL